MTAPDAVPAHEVIEVSKPIEGTRLGARLRLEMQRHHVLVQRCLVFTRRIEVLEARNGELLHRLAASQQDVDTRDDTIRHLNLALDREARRLHDLIAGRDPNAEDFAVAARAGASC